MPQSDSLQTPLQLTQTCSAEVTSRRDFLTDALCLTACVAPFTDAQATNTPPEPASTRATQESKTLATITPATIAEAEKLHALRFTAAQRRDLAAAMPAQVETVKRLRRVPRPIALQPALHFDPRLPGESYPQQRNLVRLASADEAPLPRDDGAVAYAPVTQLAHWIRTGQLMSGSRDHACDAGASV